MKSNILTQTHLCNKLREMEILYEAKTDTVGVEIIINESKLIENDPDDEKWQFVFGQGFKLHRGIFTKHFPRYTKA